MTLHLEGFLSAAIVQGYTIVVGSEGEIDYSGSNKMDALDAIEAVDEADVHFVNSEGMVCGWLYVVNDLDDDERVADMSDIAERWEKEALD